MTVLLGRNLQESVAILKLIKVIESGITDLQMTHAMRIAIDIAFLNKVRTGITSHIKGIEMMIVKTGVTIKIMIVVINMEVEVVVVKIDIVKGIMKGILINVKIEMIDEKIEMKKTDEVIEIMVVETREVNQLEVKGALEMINQ